MTLARLKARNLIEEYGIDDPSILTDHLEDLCFELGTSIQYQPLDGAEARIVAKDGRGIITINSNEKLKERKKFSIGHELGHFLLHCKDTPEFSCSRKDMTDWFAKHRANNREMEANEFSIELLIPEKLAKPLVDARSPSVEAIEELASTFGMSLSASALRYPELCNEPVAVVFFSKKKGVRPPKLSRYFAQQEYWFHSGPLDEASVAFDVASGKDYSRMTAVDASAWIELPEWLQEEVVMEQARYFPSYDSGFSLLWIKSGKLLRN